MDLPKITRRWIDNDRKYMPIGINPYYYALANGYAMEGVLPEQEPSQPLLNLVMPSEHERDDLSGELDVSNQLKYSPDILKGKIIHKYKEIVLARIALACSAHCRYCYVADFFTGSTGKGIAFPQELYDYIRQCNSKEKVITEVLLSGGDPLVLKNRQFYKYLETVAEAGIETIRIGTKEIVFRPQRILDLIPVLHYFNERYPKVHLNFMFHITHPDEFLLRGAARKWIGIVDLVVDNLSKLGLVSMTNQTPIIRGVNDDAETLHILHKELRHRGIRTQYIFQCRPIVGHKHFAVPLETAWAIHNESQKGLSGLAKSQFVMAAEEGKLEVVGLNSDQIIFKVIRSPIDALGQVKIYPRNPTATWITDYEKMRSL